MPSKVEWVLDSHRAIEATFTADVVRVIEWAPGARMISFAQIEWPGIWDRVFDGLFHVTVEDDAITIGPLRITVDDSTIRISRITIVDGQTIGEIPRGNAVVTTNHGGTDQ